MNHVGNIMLRKHIIHSFDRHLLNTCYIQGNLQGYGFTVVNKKNHTHPY